MKPSHLLMLAPMMLLAACAGVRDDKAGATRNGSGAYDAAAAGTAGQGQGYGATPVDSSTLNSNLSPQQQLASIGDRVFFTVDQYEVSAEATATLDKQAAFLRSNPNISLTIEGHADERGTREYNLALGQRRADSVRRYLIASGIEASRLQTVSFGKERPAVAGSGQAVWDQNRRAVSVVN
ncbi:peptidoglycan-associated lipoprotein Pal [Niveispirillum sp. SYP-B3756]|uniref:peptidoglycan-associated lipoprotein Pal n=1 Tax=Niveispirillum sp. SYP-B3756 TaxID=2662178 RepID=UPI0012929FD0|nr:peptidoglycan-associated lipoprotein Pal [Niveispirillum sp. SYP-B3756]MQP67109.1 peptidoglycan-associated lipoprotein Pal [Niveispirillum sp. SYP-B3756]